MDLQNDMLAYFGQTSTKPRQQRTARQSARIAPTVQPKKDPAPIVLSAPKPVIECVKYSDKSFAIFGDTKPIKDKLADLGGKFNNFLKRDGVNTPGWIFSNARRDAVRKALAI